jgi:hypothetical protein
MQVILSEFRLSVVDCHAHKSGKHSQNWKPCSLPQLFLERSVLSGHGLSIEPLPSCFHHWATFASVRKDVDLLKPWWYMIVIPALGRLRQADCEFKSTWATYRDHVSKLQNRPDRKPWWQKRIKSVYYHGTWE